MIITVVSLLKWSFLNTWCPPSHFGGFWQVVKLVLPTAIFKELHTPEVKPNVFEAILIIKLFYFAIESMDGIICYVDKAWLLDPFHQPCNFGSRIQVEFKHG